MAVMMLSDTIEKDEAFALPKSTAVVPLRCDPLMVTDVPVVPDVGANEWMDGTEGVDTKVNPFVES